MTLASTVFKKSTFQKFTNLNALGSKFDDFLRVFTIYGHVGHLGHVTRTICLYFGQLIKSSLHMKFEFDWPNIFCNILMGIHYD